MTTIMPSLILEYVKNENTEELKDYILSLNSSTREEVFKQLIIELYKGNDWIIEDAGDKLLLYENSDKNTPFLTIRTHTSDNVLLIEDVTKVMANLHQSTQTINENFSLITILGFEEEAYELEYFHYRLDDWEYVEQLVKGYNNNLRSVELLPHNQAVYREIWSNWRRTNKVAAVQATGTGKTFLILKCLNDFKYEKCLVLAPSFYILSQIKEHNGSIEGNITFLTYQKVATMTDEEIQLLNPSLIILDEFHRCGANLWGQAINRILQTNQEAKVLGTSATPIRFLDHARNMAQELFEGTLASNMSLTEAIAKQILPMPIYVSTLYSLDEEIDDIKKKIMTSEETDERKDTLLKRLSEIRIDWNNTKGVTSVIKKYITPEHNKMIVFCRDKKHLMKMERIVSNWFSELGFFRKINSFKVIYNERKSQIEFQDFKESTPAKDEINLLF